MKEFDKDEYVEQGGLYVDDGCIWYEGIKYLPERTCHDIAAVYGKFVCGACGCVVHDTSVIDNGGLYHCPDCGDEVIDE